MCMYLSYAPSSSLSLCSVCNKSNNVHEATGLRLLGDDATNRTNSNVCVAVDPRDDRPALVGYDHLDGRHVAYGDAAVAGKLRTVSAETCAWSSRCARCCCRCRQVANGFGRNVGKPSAHGLHVAR